MSKFALRHPAALYVSEDYGNDPAAILNWGFILRYEQHHSVYLTAALIAHFLFDLDVWKVFWIERCIPKLRLCGIPLAILAFGDEAALPMALIHLPIQLCY